MGTMRSANMINDAQTTGRQRFVGGRPSGNSSTDRVRTNVNPGAHTQRATQAARSASGRDPGETTLPYAAYAVADTSIESEIPMIRKTHPIRFSDRRDAMIQPTMP